MVKKIAFLGAGFMGEGMIREIIRNEVTTPRHITAFDISEQRLTFLENTYGIDTAVTAREAISMANLVVIATKPQDIASVMPEVKAHAMKEALILSICAGIEIDALEAGIGADRSIVRVMPNTMIDVKRGCSALAANGQVTKEDLALATSVLDALGQTMPMNESLMNAFTGYSAAGPATIYEFMMAMIDAGVLVGMSRSDATDITLENMMGACEMVRQTGEHPRMLQEKMTSPGGVTIAGLHELRKAGFTSAVERSAFEAVKRSQELGS